MRVAAFQNITAIIFIELLFAVIKTIVKEVIVYTVEHLDEECKNQFLETSFVYSTELSSEVSGINNASRL